MGSERSRNRLHRLQLRRVLGRVLIAAMVAGVFPGVARAAATTGGGGRVDAGAYQSPEGTYAYLAYVPRGWKEGKRWPLYVMLHGCGTTPYQQMQADAMNPIADREHVILLYADVFDHGQAIPGVGQCWRGASGLELTSELRGGGGDADAVAAMTRAVMARYTVDPQRVYLMGMSAGSFQVSDTVAAYPDLYAAAGEDAAGGYSMGLHCIAMNDDVVPYFSRLAITAMGTHSRPIPFFTIGGTTDALGETPAPGGCARLAFEQWMATDNTLVSGSPDSTAYRQDDRSTRKGTVHRGYGWTRYVWRDRDGCEMGERWVVNGMGHFWSGGSSDPKWAAFTDPKGPSAAAASWRFFKQFTLSGHTGACSPA